MLPLGRWVKTSELLSENVNRSVSRRADERTDTDDAEKKLLDGNLVGGPDLAKTAREQQVKADPAKARESEQAEETVAEQRRHPRGQKPAQGRAQKKRDAIDDVKIGDATNPLLRRHGVVDEVGGAQRHSAP